MKRKLTQEQVDEICKLYEDGKSQKDIRHMFGIGRLTIIKHLKDKNIVIRDKNISKEISNSICKEYINGKSIQKISKLFNIPTSTIFNVLKRSNIERRKIGKLSTNQIDDICNRYLLGEKQANIAKIYHISPSSFPFHFKKRNINNPRKRLSKEEISEICVKYKNGLSTEKLAKIYKVDSETIRYQLMLNSVDRRNSKDDIYRIHALDKTVFDTITEESAYFIGFLLADGCIATRNGKSSAVVLNLSYNDINHIRKFLLFLKSDSPIRIIIKTQSICGQKAGTYITSSVSIVSKYLVNRLSEYNVIPRKSLIATPPESLIDDRNFWRGMVDGDGWVYTSKNKHRNKDVLHTGICGTFNVCKQFQEFTNRNGNTSKVSIIRRTNHFAVDFCGENAINIVNILYNPSTIYLERKYNCAKKFFIAPNDTYLQKGPLPLFLPLQPINKDKMETPVETVPQGQLE